MFNHKKLINKFSHSSLIKLVLVLFLVIIICSAYLLSRNLNTQTKTNQLVCADQNYDLLESASNVMANDKTNELKIIVDKIQSLSDYQMDPNCLYVITNYYINISNPEKARENFDKLVIVYNPEIEFVPIFSTMHFKNKDLLKSTIEFLEKSRTDLEKNALFGPAV